ncbi:hypothetical protein JCM31271_24370 [Halorubrum trueperi]|uniref:Uncharacterized protein n=1 Tax=Halorubrum trueperi TaxID=2004704 RepID=A0ABD5UFP5_9EURY
MLKATTLELLIDSPTFDRTDVWFPVVLYNSTRSDSELFVSKTIGSPAYKLACVSPSSNMYFVLIVPSGLWVNSSEIVIRPLSETPVSTNLFSASVFGRIYVEFKSASSPSSYPLASRKVAAKRLLFQIVVLFPWLSLTSTVTSSVVVVKTLE